MINQPTLPGVPPLPPERRPGRPTKAAAEEHARAIRKAVMAGRPAARKRAEQRAQQASDHADRVWSNWSGQAARLTLEYGRTAGSAGFLMEEARVYAESKGLDAPPDKRSWGHVAKRLSRGEPGQRLEKCGVATDNYGSNKTRWRVV